MVDGSEIGRRISHLRQQKAMTLPDLAARAQISKGYLWSLETHAERRPSDPSPNPGLDVLAKLAAELGTTVAALVDDHFHPAASSLGSQPKDLPAGLQEFLLQREQAGSPLPGDIVTTLAGMKLRGRRPQTVKEWSTIFEVIENVIWDKE